MKAILPLLTQTFDILRPVAIPDGQGGWMISEVAVGSIPGHYRKLSASEQTSARQRQAEIHGVLYTEAGADVRRGDRARGAGVDLVVLAVRDPHELGHHLEIDCREIQLAGECEGGGS